MKYIEQTSVSECGLACVAMVISNYDTDVSLTLMRNKWGIGRDGASLGDLKSISESYGLKTKAIRTNDISNVIYPAIIFNGKDHFVVAKGKDSNNRLIIYDPSNGIYKESFEKFNTNNGVIMLIFSKNASIKKNDCIDYTPRKYFQKILKNNIFLFLIFLIISISVQSLSVIFPLFMQNFINIIVTNKNFSYFNIISLTIILLLIYPILTFLKIYISNLVQLKLDKTILKDFVGKIIALPYKFFSLIDQNDIVYRYNGSVILREIFSERLFSIWLNIGLIIFSLIIIFLNSIYIFFFLLFIIFLQIFIYIISFKEKKYLSGRELSQQSSSLGFFMNIVNSIQLIKVNSLEKYFYNYWETDIDKYWNTFKKRTNYSGIFVAVNTTISSITPLIVSIFGILLVKNGLISIGSILSLYILTSYVVSPMSQIVESIDQCVYGFKYFDNILDIQNNNSEFLNLNGKQNFIQNNINISVNKVSYKYSPMSVNVLNNISFEVSSGDSIGIVGKSGSGKSTLGMILLSLFSPSNGSIKINNIDYTEINKSYFRNNIGFVQQNPVILNGSILDNIVLHRPFDKEKLLKSAEQSEILEYICKLPMGFNTPMESGSDTLSGGQIQRIAIARALYGDPKLIVFDEATSALDAITERKIFKNIKSINAIKIFITHQLNGIINSDKIIVLKDGNMCGIGKHNELLKNNNYYNLLYTEYIDN